MNKNKFKIAKAIQTSTFPNTLRSIKSNFINNRIVGEKAWKLNNNYKINLKVNWLTHIWRRQDTQKHAGFHLSYLKAIQKSGNFSKVHTSHGLKSLLDRMMCCVAPSNAFTRPENKTFVLLSHCICVYFDA